MPNKFTIDARVEERKLSMLSTLPNDSYLSSPSRSRRLWEQRISFGDSTVIRKLDVLDDIPSIVPISLAL